jgi:hypothetical protein
MTETFGPYTCSQCGGRFEKAVSDDEARAEADAVFGDQEAQAIVCEDCFEKLVPLVSSVVVHREGAHEAVNVWVRGQLVGKLLVGEGQGEPLRTQLLAVVSLKSLLAERGELQALLATAEARVVELTAKLAAVHELAELQEEPARRVWRALLAEIPAFRIPITGPGSHVADLAALRAEQEDNERLEARIAELEATLERVRALFPNNAQAWVITSDAWYAAIKPAPAQPQTIYPPVFAEELAGVQLRPATDAEQREALDRAAAAHLRADQVGQDIIRQRFDADDPRRQALDKVLAGVTRTKRMGEGD